MVELSSVLFLIIIVETIVIIGLLDKYTHSLRYIKLLEETISYEINKNKINKQEGE
ncbi:hypothetical protein K5V21_12645 [Clostridium sardiniense]|uniref:Uncharacterized protein n=1 Tax=Clostridium sardiniense TaxID=29369 RepID=A0ABS7KZQ8_CLOSR|nr:hypothetical protein [Clostridium sardiniense]MBY0756296.1 hypothetical protein [Clostridium sardiniense]MDQ0461450.1 hypothetical protein [Clostridium sardiniense]